MKYYYLNSDNQILGPHTAGEMTKMLNEGLIHNDTLIARAGDNGWRKVSDFHFDSENETCSTWNIMVSTPAKMSIPACFVRTLANSFVLKGRSQRKECWVSFIALGVICACFAGLPRFLITHIDFLAARYNCTGDSSLSLEKLIESYPGDCLLNIYVLFFSFLCLFSFVSIFSLTVRRYHDMGYTLLLPLLAYIVIPFVCVFILSAGFDLSYTLILTFSLVLYIPQLVVSGVCLFIPGDKRDNKYGRVLN